MFYIFRGPRFFLIAPDGRLNRHSGYSFSTLWARKLCPISEVNKVWAIPVSLATTPRIIGYFLFLEVLRCFSSPGSRSSAYIFSWRQHDMTHARFPHSEIFGSKLVWQLPEAYRSLLRPSSVSYVKASVMCAWVTFYDVIERKTTRFSSHRRWQNKFAFRLQRNRSCSPFLT